jgi:hypothetical protein
MELKPHPTREGKALVTLENRNEDVAVNHRLPMFSWQALKHHLLLYRESLGPNLREKLYGVPTREYPRDVVLTRRDLGHVASRSLIEQDVRVARQITDFFETQSQPLPITVVQQQ